MQVVLRVYTEYADELFAIVNADVACYLKIKPLSAYPISIPGWLLLSGHLSVIVSYVASNAVTILKSLRTVALKTQTLHIC